MELKVGKWEDSAIRSHLSCMKYVEQCRSSLKKRNNVREIKRDVGFLNFAKL